MVPFYLAVASPRWVGRWVMNSRGRRVGLPFLIGRLPGLAAKLWAVVGKDGAEIAPPREYLVFQYSDEVLCTRGG